MKTHTLRLPAEFATGICIHSPDTGKERVYTFEQILNEEYEHINAWLEVHPDPEPEQILGMLHDIAIWWASEDLVENENHSFMLNTAEKARLQITYIKENKT